MELKLSKESSSCNECNSAVNYKSMVKGKKITKIYELHTESFVICLCTDCLNELKVLLNLTEV
jgi:hypothetical protein